MSWAKWTSTTPRVERDGSDGVHLATEKAVPCAAQPAQSFYQSAKWWQEEAVPPPPILTLAELQAMDKIQGMGGKEAWRKQRELRVSCLADGIFEVDLSNTTWSWRGLLRALPAEVGASIVGTGVTAFKFRLLANVLDPNYAQRDTGEKHVFEVSRLDGSTCQLHFHKSGKMDAPTFQSVHPPAGHGLLPPANSRVAGDAPLVYKSEDHLEHETYKVGKNEAHAACQILLGDYPGARSIDITDEVGFAWKRFLKTQMAGRDIIGPGINQACVVLCPSGPSLAFSRTDGWVCLVTPSNMRSVPPYRILRRCDAREYEPQRRATQSWMRHGLERGMSTSSQ